MIKSLTRQLADINSLTNVTLLPIFFHSFAERRYNVQVIIYACLHKDKACFYYKKDGFSCHYVMNGPLSGTHVYLNLRSFIRFS